MNGKRWHKQSKIGMGLLSVLILPVTAWALNLATKPLYLANRVDPNIFIELDDSGSMDWEVITQKYWYYSAYWGSGGESNRVESGMWRAYTGSARDDFGYWFNNSDNVYSNATYPSAEYYTTSHARDWRVRAATFNVLYYNPTVDYVPWPGMNDASFSSARSNPQTGTTGYDLTRDLANVAYEVVTDDAGYTNDSNPDNPPGGKNAYQARSAGNGLVDLWDTHTRYTVGSSTVTKEVFNYSARTIGDYGSCGASNCIVPTVTTTTYATSDTNVDGHGRTIAQMQQNIANWYQYYRRRSFVAKGAIARVVTANPGFRYGLSLINDYGTLFEEMPGAAEDSYATHNNALLQALFNYGWQSQSTPLRLGLDRTGKYFAGTLSGHASPITEACQQNFTLLFTDGYWNDNSTSLSLTPGDQDGDSFSKTLADVAYYYYKTDLRGDLANEVPLTTNIVPADTATHQHMVTFGVSFGVVGNLTDPNGDGLPNQTATDTNSDGKPDINGNWGDPISCSDCAEKVDDLWHASFNSRGTFVAAQTPEAVEAAIATAMGNIASRTSSSASVALNTGSLQSNTALFQARFESGDWSGDLVAYDLDDQGNVDTTTPVWNAREKLNTQNPDTGRTILTFHPTTRLGIPFRWANLVASQQAHLNDNPDTTAVDNDSLGSSRLSYLRGVKTNEGDGATNFRRRNYLLGDITHSDPFYVGPPSLDYPDGLETGASYNTFKTAWASRTPMIYAGANDGMLHGFNANTAKLQDGSFSDSGSGQEKLAYVPNKLFAKLGKLTSRSYLHQYLVNGSVTVADAYGAFPGCTSGSCWRTILVGGYAGGGQGLFALDVTDPASFSENNANKILLWEFTDASDTCTTASCDNLYPGTPFANSNYTLGYTFSRFSIVRMNHGEWAVVFGNGYNNNEADGYVNSTAKAALYIVRLQDGVLLRRITTPSGAGLASPAVVDINGDYVADYAYAGDLSGNLWKFDLSSSSVADWSVALSGNPLFTATPPSSLNPDCTGTPVADGPQEIIDNSTAGKVTTTGTWSSRDATNAVNGSYLRAPLAADGARSITYTFSAVTTAGTYAVYEYHRARDSHADNTPHIITSPSGSTTVAVNQTVNGYQYNQIGTVTLEAGGVVTVQITNNTTVNSYVAADAVKLKLISIPGVPASTQPITVRPEIGPDPRSTGGSGLMVYFGTGKYLETTDNNPSCAATQAVYGVLDAGAPVAKSALLQQNFEYEGSRTFGSKTYDLRVISENPVTSWSSYKGCYFNLVNPNDSLNHGEVVVNNPVLSNGRVIVTSTIGADQACSTVEGGWLYEVDWKTCGRLENTYDMNDDQTFNADDRVEYTRDGQTRRASAAGKKDNDSGIPTSPSVLEGPSGTQYKYISDSAKGTPTKTTNAAPAGSTVGGRQSWRQLFVE